MIFSQRLSVERAVERARCLAELAAVLDEVGTLAPGLAACRLDPIEITSLQARLATLQSEIDSIRKGHPTAASEIDRFWS